MNISQLWIVALGLGAGVGCVADEGDEVVVEDGDDETSEAVQQLGGLGAASWGDTKYSKADIGSATNRACFLSGVAGYLTTGSFPTGNSQGGAGVVINPITNHWEIYVQPTITGATLQVWARCMSTTSLTAPVTWRANNPKAILAPVTPGRRCFFTEFRSGRDNTYAHGGFYSTLDQVYIANDGVNWYIDGSQSGLMWATARCMNVTQDITTTFNWANPGTSNTVAATPKTSDNACMLTQVGGKIANSADWNAGPHVRTNTTYNYYDFFAKDGNGGRVKCVR